MKESNFYSDEFEQLIREKTEQYKMYPSEKVWKGVHNSLHTKRRWFIGTMALLVGGILFFAGRELIAPSAHPVLASKTAAVPEPGAAPSKTAKPAVLSHSALTAFRSPNTVAISRDPDDASDIDGEAEEDQFYKGITISLTHLVVSQPDLSEFLSHAVHLPDQAPALPVTAARSGIAADGTDGVASTTGTPGTQASGANGFPAATAANGAAGNAAVNGGGAAGNITSSTGLVAKGGPGPENIPGHHGTEEENTADLTAISVLESLNARASHPNNTVVRTRSGNSNGGAGGKIADSAGSTPKAIATAIAEAQDRQRINWLHDYALYTLKTQPLQARTFLQLTFSPTVNYRSLSGGDFGPGKFVPNGAVSPLHLGDAQKYVDHQPALGFQVGGSLLYRVTRNLSIKGGLQFNFSRYTIKAYSSNPQQATIALSSYYGYIIDSLTSYTRVGNFGGRTQETFSNDYFQLSAPLGFELRVFGNERLQFNVGATIQPSYLLNTNPYMLTSDYTGYTKEPSLFRRWNFSGGLEAFLTYKIGGIRLQAGPEFRYQLLSTYTSQYPISENLKGYGLKIGIVKELP